ncbi:MAG: FkbM family methyltransferase [Thiobacillus sp.]|nr:FkbM family methyltransferase [Thiobacillus sp.]
MNSILDKFHRAYGCMYASPFAKLIRPGLHKFLFRYWVDRTRRVTPVDANLFFGGHMRVVLPEVVSRVIYTYGFFDAEVTYLVSRYIKPGDTVLDVGAHFGYVSVLSSHLVGDAGRVYSFEPTPSTFAVLSENAKSRANITALNLGAGKENSSLDIADYGLQYCAWNTMADESRMPTVLAGVKANKVKVNVVKLDDYLAEKGIAPSFIKIDAENFEADVIAGLANTIQKARPIVLMETGSVASLTAAGSLANQGYRPHVVPRPGVVEEWQGPLDEANSRFKDILFLP